jgi:signal transduction histidine kinase
MIELAKRAIDAQENERFYLSSEIHDTLLQELASMLYFVKNIDIRNNDPDFLGKREMLIENIKSVINRGRDLISHFEPLQDPHITLIQGIKKSLDLRFSGTGVALYFNHPPKLPEIKFFIKTNILRIVQEAFMNIYKHGRATAISVTISLDKDQFIIKIKDNGAGFSPAKTDRGKKGHYGLSSMEERARLIGGTLDIISKPGFGTVVTAEIPLK